MIFEPIGIRAALARVLAPGTPPSAIRHGGWTPGQFAPGHQASPLAAGVRELILSRLRAGPLTRRPLSPVQVIALRSPPLPGPPSGWAYSQPARSYVQPQHPVGGGPVVDSGDPGYTSPWPGAVVAAYGPNGEAIFYGTPEYAAWFDAAVNRRGPGPGRGPYL
jgi:hypothetical protein